MKTKVRTKGKPGKESHSSYGLSDRELEILTLLADGLTKKQIAGKLMLSYHTIDSHIRKIYKKMGVNLKIHAITKAIKEKILN